MKTSDPLPIFTVSLTAGKKYKAYAVFDGERLWITAVIPITGIFSTWKNALIEEIKDKKKQGFIVLVDETGDTIAQHGTHYRLDDIAEDTKQTNLQTALTTYFEMVGMDTLILHPDCQSVALKMGEGSWIEKKQNDKGITFYNVDWKKITGAHLAILLCVIAAVAEPLSERFLNAMQWGKTPDYTEEHPARRFKALIDNMDYELEAELNKRSLAWQ